MHLSIICSWCGTDMGQKPCKSLDKALPRVTHSICAVCKKNLEEDLQRDLSNKSETN